MLDPNVLYSCAVCGNALSGLEWQDHPDTTHTTIGKEYCCPSCGHGINEDEMYE